MTGTAVATAPVPSDENVSAADMVRTMKNMKMDDGENVISVILHTFSVADGKTKKDDIFVHSVEAAVSALKQMVDMAVEVTKEKYDDDDDDHARKWKFETAPLKEFGKTLDDIYTSFAIWGSKDEGVTFNVSRSFRRLQAYASWMDSHREDLTESKMCASALTKAHDIWKMRGSTDKDGHFVWWLDKEAMDTHAMPSFPVEESLRYMVWYSHYVMFHPSAQKNGVIVVENIDKLGFFEAFTIIPPKLGAKIDRLTIGVLPVKIKKFYLMETSRWIKCVMAVISPFMSKKMKSRIELLNKDYDKLYSAIGGEDYLLNGFGKSVGGRIVHDDVTKTYFS